MIDINAYLGHFAFRQLRHQTAEGLLRLMDRARIEKAAVSSASSITYRNAHSGNEEVHAQMKAGAGRLIPFAVLNPIYAGWREDLRICQEEFGMRGLRLYPRWHGYQLTDPAALELMHAAAERKMAITIPVRVEDRRQGSWLVDIPDVPHAELAAAAKAVPEGRFVFLNGIGYANSILGQANNGLPANYSVDISLLTALVANEIGRLLQTLGEDRVLFGTNAPFHYPEPAALKVDVLDAPERIKEKIRRGNALRLLG